MIMEIIEFMFQSLGHFIGMMLLLGLLSNFVITMVRGHNPYTRKREEKSDENDEDSKNHETL